MQDWIEETCRPGRIIKKMLDQLVDRNKVLRIADDSIHGWETVWQYKGNDIADDSDDAKKIRAAEQRAAAKKKKEQGYSSSTTTKRVFSGSTSMEPP